MRLKSMRLGREDPTSSPASTLLQCVTLGDAFPTSKQIFLGAYDQFEMILIF